MLLFLTNMVRFGYVKIIMGKRLSLTEHILEWCCLDRFVVHFYRGLIEWRFLLHGLHHGLGSDPQFRKFRTMILSVYKAPSQGHVISKTWALKSTFGSINYYICNLGKVAYLSRKKVKNNNSTYFIGLLWWLRWNIKKQNYFY